MKAFIAVVVSIQAVVMLLSMVCMAAEMGTGFSRRLVRIGKVASRTYLVCWALFAAEFVGALLYFVVIPWGFK